MSQKKQIKQRAAPNKPKHQRPNPLDVRQQRRMDDIGPGDRFPNDHLEVAVVSVALVIVLLGMAALYVMGS